MRRSLLALGTTLLMLAPITASAAFTLPSELFQSLAQDTAASDFSLMMNGGSDGSYAAAWISGSQQGTDVESLQLTLKATIDFVEKGKTIRVKGAVMIVNGTLYAKLDSISGTNEVLVKEASAGATLNQWFALPLDEGTVQSITGESMSSVTGIDLKQADSIFEMRHSNSANGTVYTLHFTEEFSALIAQTLREGMNDTSSVGTDFFPWEALAKLVTFTMTVRTDLQDRPLASAFSFMMNSPESYVRLSGSDAKRTSPLSLSAPANAMSIIDYLTGSPVETPDAPAMTEPTSTLSPASEDCNDPSVTPQEYLMLQRIGSCPVSRTSTRYRR